MGMTLRPHRNFATPLLFGLVLFTVACDNRAPEVTVAAVARENLGASVTTNGKVEPVAPSVLRARLDTVVLDVVAAQGQPVRAGDVILHLDVATAVAGLARARAEALAAEEQLAAARAGGAAEEVAQLNADIRKNDAELNRLRREREALTRLLAKQAATQNELDENKLALDRAEAQSRLLQQKKDELARRSKLDVERAQLHLERARGEIRNFESQAQGGRLTAPVAGTLYLLPVKKGDFVRTGDVLAEVADLSRLRVRVFVDEPEMGALETGQAAEITWDALPGRVWRGKTETVPRAVVQRGSRFVGELLCSVENKDLDLLPNTNVNVVIRVRERINTFVVPRASIRQDGNTRYVFVLEGTKLRRRDVKLGISSATKFEILEGLSEKDRVVIPGNVELHEGLEVRIKS